MSGLEARVSELEQRTGGKSRPYWNPPIVEVREGDRQEDIDIRLAEIEAAARAEGWLPGDGLLCIEVHGSGVVR